MHASLGGSRRLRRSKIASRGTECHCPRMTRRDSRGFGTNLPSGTRLLRPMLGTRTRCALVRASHTSSGSSADSMSDDALGREQLRDLERQFGRTNVSESLGRFADLPEFDANAREIGVGALGFHPAFQISVELRVAQFGTRILRIPDLLHLEMMILTQHAPSAVSTMRP